MAGEITLPVGATAEPLTCGSCKFFLREMSSGPYEAAAGHCTFRLPPPKQFFKVMTYEETGELDRTANWVKDTHGCDLYQPDKKSYIVQRIVPLKG